MTYSYEQLGDEAFQQLVQTLLVKELPNVQCFPVGLPDGGRDATQVESGTREGLVIQVKMSRRPEKLDDPLKWLAKAIDGELEKIDRLSQRGYKRYRLVSNLSASSHLDTGLMDRASALIASKLAPYGVSGDLWWRDDLDRRLDGDFDLKLRYPHLLNGPDIVRLLWEHGDDLKALRRQRDTLDAYMRNQYEEDHTVRFKQIELESTELFDLFVDVPIMKPHRMASSSAIDELVEAERRIQRSGQQSTSSEVPHNVLARLPGDRQGIGGVDLLVDPQFVGRNACVVVEGAPGQGKTTLSQYLIQVQRARLLQRKVDVAKLSKHVAGSAIRLPFKIELRDLALWLRGIDPWTGREHIQHDRPRSLEGAISAHVSRYSGGLGFDVEDFRDTIRRVPVIIALDALDEVADLRDRKAVVEAVSAALNRLAPYEQNLQVVVTSRPSAVSGSPTFSRTRFSYLRLTALSSDLAMVYASKWAKARRLSPKNSDSVLNTLRQKLHSPHMAELARNTMQLSILLSLIYVHNDSLPDRRTELYDEYTKLFFSREAEKSDIVRDHRTRLVAIHRFLGYYLHAQAESSRSNGRISEAELKKTLHSYLESERIPTDLVDDLFTGVAERVVALVSRLEGTYEFEIQPLREYFAARYLYNTAPYSPSGRAAQGTKPVRFDGLARNPYWLNVTRFYAGCFSDGELLDLAHRVTILLNASQFKHKSYPRALAVALLQDYVFDQSTHATEIVALALSDSAGLRWLGGSPMTWSRGRYIDGYVPPNAGGSIIARKALERVESTTKFDDVQDLCTVASQSEFADTLVELWQTTTTLSSVDISRLGIATLLGIVDLLHSDVIEREIREAPSEDRDSLVYQCILGSLNPQKLPDDLIDRVPRSILEDRTAFTGARSSRDESTEANHFCMITQPHRWTVYLTGGNPRIVLGRAPSTQDRAGWKPQIKRMSEWIDFALGLRSSSNFTSSLESWQSLVDSLERTFGGPSWRSIELAVMSGGIKSRTERGRGASELLAPELPLTSRVRYARLKHDVAWWKRQLTTVATELDVALACLTLVTWARGSVFTAVLPELNSATSRLSEKNSANFICAVLRSRIAISAAQRLPDIKDIDITQLTPAVRAAVVARCNDANIRRSVALSVVNSELNGHAKSLIIDEALQSLTTPLNQDSLTIVRELGRAGSPTFMAFQHYLYTTKTEDVVPNDVADEILGDPWAYPATLVTLAQTTSDKHLARSKPIREVAQNGRWFM